MTGLLQIWQFLWDWYNLPFSISLLFFLGLSALQFIGLGGEQEIDQELEVDTDLDLDTGVDLDADIDLDADVDLDVDLDTDADVDVGDGLSAWGDFLAFIGLGQAPLTLVLLLLFLTFGFTGWVLNSAVISILGSYPGIALGGTLPLSMLSSVLITSRLSRLLNRITPSVSTTAMSRKQLVGHRGTVVSAQVTGRYGQVRVKDRSGASLTLFARIEGDTAPIKRDQEVVIVAYDEAEHTYTVVSSDL
jgi:membrane protein implicated in regulation of membrane protease activity